MKSASPPKVTLRLRIGEHPVTVHADLPPERARADQLLPILQAVVDAEVDCAARDSQAAGRPISCCRGCSACCRAQPVPVTPPEAYALARLVESLPEDKQSPLRERFARNEAALDEAGLSDEYFRPRGELTRVEAREIAVRYIALRLPCPFLVDDACSIYEHRPLVCRQYLVTSPSALCNDPLQNPVDVLPLRLKPAGATLQVLSEALGRHQASVPLALALRYVELHRAELERLYTAEAMSRRWLEHLLAQPLTR